MQKGPLLEIYPVVKSQTYKKEVETKSTFGNLARANEIRNVSRLVQQHLPRMRQSDDEIAVILSTKSPRKFESRIFHRLVNKIGRPRRNSCYPFSAGMLSNFGKDAFEWRTSQRGR